MASAGFRGLKVPEAVSEAVLIRQGVRIGVIPIGAGGLAKENEEEEESVSTDANERSQRDDGRLGPKRESVVAHGVGRVPLWLFYGKGFRSGRR